MSKADNLTFPIRKGTTADTPVVYVAVTTNHAAIQLPAALRGKFVKLINESSATTDYVDFFFSDSQSAEVDRTVASSTSGQTSPKLGERIYGTQEVQGRTPFASDGAAQVYLIVEGSTTINLRVVLAEQ